MFQVFPFKMVFFHRFFRNTKPATSRPCLISPGRRSPSDSHISSKVIFCSSLSCAKPWRWTNQWISSLVVDRWPLWNIWKSIGMMKFPIYGIFGDWMAFQWWYNPMDPVTYLLKGFVWLEYLMTTIHTGEFGWYLLSQWPWIPRDLVDISTLLG